MNTWTWRCDGCGKRVESNGYLLFSNPNSPGDYPKWNTNDELNYQKTVISWEEKQREKNNGLIYCDDLIDFPEVNRCAIHVYHRKCDPIKDGNEYWLDISRCNEHGLLDTVAHLLEKQWFGEEEAKKLIRRFQDSRCDFVLETQQLRPSLRFQILNRDNFTCRYCGTKAGTNGAVLHVDHIKPQALGGASIPENLVTSCQHCNLGKGKRELENGVYRFPESSTIPTYLRGKTAEEAAAITEQLYKQVVSLSHKTP